jgi:hypothetical protein
MQVEQKPTAGADQSASLQAAATLMCDQSIERSSPAPISHFSVYTDDSERRYIGRSMANGTNVRTPTSIDVNVPSISAERHRAADKSDCRSESATSKKTGLAITVTVT